MIPTVRVDLGLYTAHLNAGKDKITQKIKLSLQGEKSFCCEKRRYVSCITLNRKNVTADFNKAMGGENESPCTG